ncbi:uncharacterized protein MYCGRDRAFT_105672 [Zymoseptoria tritici IPO323]|uniref:Uncharacterized protein n=1 Tax=Zymoseptoria tritici (strain CBS 115943 / IPO323) TaxID=336722 RepID=F9XJ68_ZYMTI|nr:uncharacterized protein MYCGRDRAFT_105672 [Zymoseptoria tritici IPO323]EGP84769.1 hypothetical protein MYCGRDRAFT_105672 [Zymoseptoria tritici IPO323]
MSQSNVGSAGVYEAGDQRNSDVEEIRKLQEEERFHEGKKNSHNPDDPKDERSIANRLEREAKRNEDDSAGKDLSTEDKLAQMDATAPAISHGNEPSKGAKIDQQLREEEEEILKKKGAYNPQ